MKNTKKRWKFQAIFSMMAVLLVLQLTPFMAAPASAFMRYYSNVPSADFPASLRDNLASQTNWQKGFIDVTKAPYNAKGDNSTDDSEAIQAAISDAYDNNLVVYFPGNKTYMVSKQLVLNHISDEWYHPGSNLPSQRKFGHILVGSTTGTPPVIRLKDGSMPAGGPLFLFQYFTPKGPVPKPPTPGLRHRDLALWYDPTNGTTDSARHYVSTMRGFDIDMGDNPDVDAISMDSAEHTALENIRIYGSFNTGIYRIPGSGGSLTNVKITGGKIGVFQDKFRPSPEITGLELIGQSQYGIQIMNARGALTVVGFKIQGPSTPDSNYRAVYAKNTEKDQIRGNFNLVDGTIEVAGSGNTAIYNYDQDAVMNNVYVKASTIIESGFKNDTVDTLAGDKDAWKKVNEYAFASGTDTGYIHVDGTEYAHTGSDVVGVSDVVDEAPAEDLISRHIWGTMPSWQTNIVDITAYGATRDNNSNDDAVAIQDAIDDTTDPVNPNGNLGKTVFIPRGHFHIKSPIMLKKGTKMIGAAQNISVIEWDNSWLPTTPQVGLDSVDDAEAGIVLSDFALVANDPSGNQGLENQRNITVLRIRGGNTTLRDVMIDRKENPQESYYKESTVVFSGNAGGKVYNLSSDNPTRITRESSIDASFRQLLIDNTFHPLAFYTSTIQHSGGVTHSEINASSNVSFYGLKYETRLTETALRPLMDITNSHKISIFGGSGLYDASGNSTNSVFKITDSDGIYFTNMARTLTYQADEKWVVNIENGTTIDSVASSDRSPLVLYKTAEKPNIPGSSEDNKASSNSNGAASSDSSSNSNGAANSDLSSVPNSSTNEWTAAFIIGVFILLAGLVAAVFWFRRRSRP